MDLAHLTYLLLLHRIFLCSSSSDVVSTSSLLPQDTLYPTPQSLSSSRKSSVIPISLSVWSTQPIPSEVPLLLSVPDSTISSYPGGQGLLSIAPSVVYNDRTPFISTTESSSFAVTSTRLEPTGIPANIPTAACSANILLTPVDTDVKPILYARCYTGCLNSVSISHYYSTTHMYW